LSFLHADGVGLLLVEPVEEALAGGGTDAVEIGGDEAHGGSRAGFQGAPSMAAGLPCCTAAFWQQRGTQAYA
jgi:hypothetical protein